MDCNYKTRPKINSKIIYKYLVPSTKTALVLGDNNSDIVEVLKQKKISAKDYKAILEDDLIEYLKNLKDKEFNLIILNIELCNYLKIAEILELVVEKSNYSIIRFRNKNINKTKITKKKAIEKAIKNKNIKVFKKLFGKKNKIYKKHIYKYYAYYSVYFITRETMNFNCEECFVDKIKSIFVNKKHTFGLAITKKAYGKK